MDPLLDEKIVLTLSRGFTEFLQNTLNIGVSREAYGPSRNEGLCYESCQAIGFHGDVEGRLFICMDGYTRMKLLPLIAGQFRVDTAVRGMADSVLMEFSNQIASSIILELQDAGFAIDLEAPESLNHKIVPIDSNLYRQYIMIFFLRDGRIRQYYGRVHLVLILKKY